MVTRRSPVLPKVDLESDLASLLVQIPRGRVTTYGALARALGDRSAAMWVARQVLHHAHTARCRCHRVVQAGGVIPNPRRARFVEQSRRLLAEGVSVESGRVDLVRFGKEEFESRRPLAVLARLQERLRERLVFAPLGKAPRMVGGVDVSYQGSLAVAAYTLVDPATRRLVWSTHQIRPVTFPYIPGYLTFRELPVLVELLRRVRSEGRLADVLLVDGTGILHPRQFGIACHLGVQVDWPTIGVAKKLLAGRLLGAKNDRGCRAVGDNNGMQLGWAVAPPGRGAKPLYVSPGHRVDLATARDVVLKVLAGHRLPEPLYWADRLSREATRRVGRKAHQE